MYEGSKAAITMVQNLKEGSELDKRVYSCTVIECQKEKEQVHILMSSGELPEISLDGIYECKISTITGNATCVGKIRERYENRAGMILCIQIINGFYETKMK